MKHQIKCYISVKIKEKSTSSEARVEKKARALSQGAHCEGRLLLLVVGQQGLVCYCPLLKRSVDLNDVLTSFM